MGVEAGASTYRHWLIGVRPGWVGGSLLGARGALARWTGPRWPRGGGRAPGPARARLSVALSLARAVRPTCWA